MHTVVYFGSFSFRNFSPKHTDPDLASDPKHCLLQYRTHSTRRHRGGHKKKVKTFVQVSWLYCLPPPWKIGFFKIKLYVTYLCFYLPLQSSPENCKHHGLYLGKDIECTLECTMRNTEPKSIKRRILGTTPPTDLLHRALLINTALIPIYNHICMALPVHQETMKKLHQEVLDFLEN